MELLQKAIDYGLKFNVNFVEARYTFHKSSTIRYVDGALKNISSGIDEGVSIRVFLDGAWGFSATSELTLDSIYKTVEQAFKLAKANSQWVKEKYEIKNLGSFHDKSIISTNKKFNDVPIEEKISLVKDIDNSMKKFDSRIKSTTTNYIEETDIIHIMNSFNTDVYKEEYSLLLSATAFSLENNIRGRGYEAIGGTGGYEIIEEKNGAEIGIKAAKKAIEQLNSKGIQPGKYTCVLDPIIVGVFAHEGIGHPAEADAIVERNSILEGLIGKTIASENVTIVDNPLIKKSYGYYEYDFEGTPAKPRKIIEKGVLKEYLHNLETASILDMEPNGAGRADSYLNEPIVRMSTIYFEKGDMSFDELIEDVKFGIYVKGFQYGYVEPSNGQYTFKSEIGYLIENGEIKYPIRDISLTGLILETLMKVDGVGNDLKIEGVGHCGKDGQFVRVGDGGPHLRVREIVVGGVE